MEILTYGLSHTQYAVLVFSWNVASDRFKDEDDMLKIKKKKTYLTNYNYRFQKHPLMANNSKNLPEPKRLLLSVSVTYDGRKESGPTKCRLMYM